MPVEFIGMIGTKDQSEIQAHRAARSSTRDYVRRFARAHEDAGFDRVLIGYASSQPDGAQVAAYAAAHTERLGFLVAHRPGFVAPDPGRPHLRHPRPVHRRPDRRAHHHRRQRRRAAPRRRLPHQGRALRPHRRVPGHPQAGLDRGRAVQLPGQATTRSRTSTPSVQLAAAAAHHALLRRLLGGGVPGRRQARRHRTRCGASRWRRRRADRLGERGRGGRRPDRRRRGSACPSGRSSARPRSWPGSGPTASWRPPRRTSTDSANRRRRGGWGTRRRRAGEPGLAAAAARPPPRASCTTARCGPRSPQATGAAGNSTALVGTPETVAQALLDYVDIGVTTHPDPRLRPVRRRHRLRPPPAAAGPRGGRPARRGEARRCSA